MPLSDFLLSILCCPACQGTLEYDRARERLVCQACRLWYPIQDGIPVMLVESAESLDVKS